jgi:hypothetical protein
LAAISPESEFNFGLSVDEPQLPPFRMGETIALEGHMLILENSRGKQYSVPCSTRTGEVFELQPPLFRDGSSYIAKVRCANEGCDFKTILSR